MPAEAAQGSPVGASAPPGADWHPSLVRLSMFATTWWSAVLLGAAVVAYSLAQTLPQLDHAPLTFWALVLLVLLGELRPILAAGGYDPQGVPVADAFVFAVMYLYGPWPAITLVAVGKLASELAKRKTPWRLAFNVGQFPLCLLSAASFMLVMNTDNMPSFSQPTTVLEPTDLLWIVPGWFAYFLVNNTLVSGTAESDHMTFGEVFFDDFTYYFVTTFAVLVLSPLVVFVVQVPIYLPLLLLPLYTVYWTAKISREKEHQSLHDALTGLPNRKHLLERLSDALDVARKAEESVALCLLDLDRFKEVNDTLGHQVGDRLLSLVAQRLNGALRPGDLVARLGGDEFAILLAPVRDEDSAIEVAQRMRVALNEPFHLEGMLFELEASIGIALFPQHGEDAEPILRRADVAMYLAKEERTGVELYVADRDQNSASRLALLGGLRSALESGEIEVHYQPQLGLGSGGVVGVEALVRWRHPSRGLVMPDDFVPMAEHSGLMGALTAYVVDRALAQVAEWRQHGLQVPVAVNVSSRDLHGTELIGVVGAALETYDLPASMLTLELTERVLTRDSADVAATLTGLRRLGVCIALDDFGTGYSSMILLKQMPVGEIKVDRSFVSRLSLDQEDVTIVRSIIDLAHGLGMRAVAEGVETEDVWDLLQDLGCDAAQGWYISRPMDSASATEWLTRHPSRRAVLRALTGQVGSG